MEEFYKNDELIEELDIPDDEDLEVVMRGSSAYPFPVVCITGSHICYSIKAAEYIGQVKSVMYKLSKDYLIMKFYDKPMYNTFAVWSGGKSRKTLYPVTIFPTFMKNRRVRTGAYRLYKYKDGFAIKIHEPLKPTE